MKAIHTTDHTTVNTTNTDDGGDQCFVAGCENEIVATGDDWAGCEEHLVRICMYPGCWDVSGTLHFVDGVPHVRDYLN